MAYLLRLVIKIGHVIKIDEQKIAVSSPVSGVNLYDVNVGLTESFDKKYGLQDQSCNKPYFTKNKELIISINKKPII